MKLTNHFHHLTPSMNIPGHQKSRYLLYIHARIYKHSCYNVAPLGRWLGVMSHSELGVQLGTRVKTHFLPLRENLRLHTLWLAAAQSTSHMVALQMGSWAPPCAHVLCVCVWASVCFCVCVRHVFRISTSEDNVNESWLSLFFLSRSFPSFHPEAGSGKLKAAIRVTERSTGIKVPD